MGTQRAEGHPGEVPIPSVYRGTLANAWVPGLALSSPVATGEERWHGSLAHLLLLTAPLQYTLLSCPAWLLCKRSQCFVP